MSRNAPRLAAISRKLTDFKPVFDLSVLDAAENAGPILDSMMHRRIVARRRAARRRRCCRRRRARRAGRFSARSTSASLDEAGAPVPDLGPADFIVREDNVAREVLRVAPADDADADRAARRHQPGRATPYIRDYPEALPAFINGDHRATRRRKNQVAIIAIGERPTVFTDYTSDRRRLDKGVNRIFAMPDSGAYLLDGDHRSSPGIQEARGAAPGHRRDHHAKGRS